MKKFYILFLAFIILSNVSFTQEEQASNDQQASSIKRKTRKKTANTEEATPQTAEETSTEMVVTTEPATPNVQPSTEAQAGTTAAQPTTPSTPTSPVEFEQKTWEKSKAVELEKEDSITLTKNETTEKIVKQAQEINKEIQATVNQILKRREESYSTYSQTDGKLDIFLQEISILNGQLKVKISQAEEQEKLTTDPNKKIELELYKRDWEQFKSNVEKVDEIENQLIGQFKEVDEKVDETLDISINTKKINLDILKSLNEQDAQTKLNQLKELQQKCNSLQNSLSTDFFNKIDSLSNQIQNEIQTLQIKAKKLSERAKELKPLEETVLTEKQPNKQNISEEQTKILPAKKKYIYNTTINATAWFINFLNSTKDLFKNLIFGKTTKQKAFEESKNKIQTEEKTTKTLAEEKAKTTEQTKNLEKSSEEIQEQHQKVQENISTEAIQSKQPQERKNFEQPEKSTWRKETEYTFGKFLDGITWLIEKTKYYSKRLYDKHAKEKITAFVTDIHTRIEELKKEEKNKAKQTPAHEQPIISEQNIDIKQKQPEATEASELGPVAEEEEKGSIPITTN